ncbi:hypothetical protein [Nocardiopsis halophila]|nr:hypothetical protein [Nocardiopsis halophila]
MADLVFVGAAAAFFALCVAYVRGCDRIISGGGDPGVAAQEAAAEVSPR